MLFIKSASFLRKSEPSENLWVNLYVNVKIGLTYRKTCLNPRGLFYLCMCIMYVQMCMYIDICIQDIGIYIDL